MKNELCTNTATTTQQRSVQEYARHYISDRGFAVFPLVKNEKRPAVKTGFKEASTDSNQIANWYPADSQLNIGIATGPVSQVWVLDLDVKDGALGMESLAELEQEHGPLPATLTCITTSGGKHLFFNYTAAMKIKSGAAIRPGVDVRAEGGYVVAVPSIVGGQPYSWLDESTPIADAPEWLLKIVSEGKQKSAALQKSSAQGGRNSFILSAAGRQMHKGHPHDAVVAMMLELNEKSCTPPLDNAEVTSIVDSVFRLYSHQVQPHQTELGLAQKMASIYRGKLRYVVETRKWLQWNGYIWRQISENKVVALAKDVIRLLHIEAEALTDEDRQKEATKFALTSESRSVISNMIKGISA
ncbi:MAG: bifunctional DNA primase/polymerase [Burkholderiales bacterium]